MVGNLTPATTFTPLSKLDLPDPPSHPPGSPRSEQTSSILNDLSDGAKTTNSAPSSDRISKQTKVRTSGRDSPELSKLDKKLIAADKKLSQAGKSIFAKLGKLADKISNVIDRALGGLVGGVAGFAVGIGAGLCGAVYHGVQGHGKEAAKAALTTPFNMAFDWAKAGADLAGKASSFVTETKNDLLRDPNEPRPV